MRSKNSVIYLYIYRICKLYSKLCVVVSFAFLFIHGGARYFVLTSSLLVLFQAVNGAVPGGVPTGEVGGPQEDAGVKKWERPWSVRELKEGSKEWTLAADAGVRAVSVFIVLCCRDVID